MTIVENQLFCLDSLAPTRVYLMPPDLAATKNVIEHIRWELLQGIKSQSGSLTCHRRATFNAGTLLSLVFKSSELLFYCGGLHRYFCPAAVVIWAWLADWLRFFPTILFLRAMTKNELSYKKVQLIKPGISRSWANRASPCVTKMPPMH